ncbi:general substrate transporter [Xylariaceae sp. FL1019]|nr:general substrate transporter [Xylariaceae sp. FL1019]
MAIGGMNKGMLLVCLVAALNCTSVGYDSAMMSSLNILDSFKEKFGITSDIQGLLTAIQNLGAIFASLFTGIMVDRIGRKGGILLAACCVLLATILHSTANTRAQFFVARIVVGFAKAFDIASVPAYLAELAPPNRRGFVGGLYWACWTLGSIIAAAVGYGARSVGGDWSWRLICIVMAGPALSCILTLPFIPESPRWLIARGREAEGLAILNRFHGDGSNNSPLVTAQFREIKEAIQMDELSKEMTYKAWWKELKSHKSNWYRAYTLIALSISEQTVGSSIITFFLTDVLDLAGITSENSQFAINLGQSVASFAAALVGICFIDRLGRVKMLVVGTAVCGVILALMAGLTAGATGVAAGRNAIVAMVFLFQISYSSTWTPLSFSYCAEILNFTIRAKGMSFYNIVDSAAGFFNQYVIPIGFDGIGWRFYIVGVVWNIFVAVLIYFTFIETKGLTLEQVEQRFSGVPRSEIAPVIEAYDGEKPISESDLSPGQDLEQVAVKADNKV